jgi:peptidoglycan/xylan/chitin deacetylase (PgdA/CDA1 family)
MNNNNIPVLMLHSVGSDIYPWSRNFLSVNVNNFERFCKYLKEKSYRALILDEWYDLQNTTTKSKQKYVTLTFDDGYLDNYVYVYPILKKYGLRGTIFVNPEFVDLVNIIPRPIYGTKGFDQNHVKDVLGFLNWNEIAEMENSGVMDIQNHTMSHNRYFSGPKIKDFLSPTSADKFDWLLWNKQPILKPHYMHINLFEHITEGHPILENDRSLAIRRYFPSEDLMNIMVDKYSFVKVKSTLNENGIRHNFIKEYETLFATGKYPGRYETDEELIKRYSYELEGSKKIFREKLNKNTEYLCWPGGGWNETSLTIADSIGYKASTVRYKNGDVSIKSNISHKSISRKGISDLYFFDGKPFKSSNKNIIVNNFQSHNGSFFIKKKLQFDKLIKYIQIKIFK